MKTIIHKLQTQQGLSLVELMIAMALGLLLTLGLTTLFVQNRNNFRQNEDFAGMQDSARFAMDVLTRDLLMAGYWGGIPDGSDIVIDTTATTGTGSLTVGNDCGPNQLSTWAFDTATPIEFLNQDETGTITDTYGCIAQTDLAANTDVLAIRRVSGRATADVAGGATTATVYEHSFYLKANNITGTVLKTGAGSTHTLTAAVPATPNKFWRYTARIYFIQPYANTAGDGIPTLCRYELDHVSSPTMVKTCLAKGVENLQIEWGIDVGGGGSQIRHTSAPGPGAVGSGKIGDIADVTTAKVSLLVRGTSIDVSQNDPKIFTIGDVTIAAANDNYRRRVYESTVHVRNKPLQP